MTRVFVVMVSVLLLTAMGCAPKDGQKTKTAKEPTQTDEFVEPEIENANLTGYVAVELTAEDQTIDVPGASFGAAPKIQKPGKKSDLNNPSFWPVTEGIAGQMEDLQWGMSTKKVFSIFENKIRDKYKEQLQANSGDLLAEDRTRTKMLRELKIMKESYVTFDGQTTGYESHMVSVEFTHNNSESMLVWDSEKFVEYLFFIKGRFWKRVRLFRLDQLAGLNFESYMGSIEGIFGVPGREIMSKDGNLERYTWRDADTYVDVIDGSAFFGVYGLRFTSAVTQANLAKLRVNAGREKGKVSASVSSLVDEVTNSADIKDHKDSVIDSYTGVSPNADDGFKSKEDSKSKKKPAAEPKKEISEEETRSLF